jgi:hypothetical protein
VALDPHDVSKFDQLGTWAVGVAIAFVGWVLRTFTHQHLESMKDLTTEIKGLKDDVSDIKGDIRAIKEHQLSTDRRLDRLEKDTD